MYVDFHVIQTVPPSCINRDDTGRPKTAVYGGAKRARVSSQSWKHAMRGAFGRIFSNSRLGFRTKHAVDLIAEKLDMDSEEAIKKATEALSNAGLKITGNLTGALFFISSKQVDKLVELIKSGEKDKKLYKQALKEFPSVDLALFGRMVAEDDDLNVDAACQVAHSISTHAVQTEYDYFTAVDDCAPSDGAGHLGTSEFDSMTLYRYATVNVSDLEKLVGEDSSSVVAGFATAFISSMPTGKQNSYANRTLPDMVYVAIREDQPVNFSGAFEKPVSSKEGFVEGSEKAFFEYAKHIYDSYCGTPKYSFIVGYDGDALGAEKKTFQELIAKLEEVC